MQRRSYAVISACGLSLAPVRRPAALPTIGTAVAVATKGRTCPPPQPLRTQREANGLNLGQNPRV
jgi:hypothetical protein